MQNTCDCKLLPYMYWQQIGWTAKITWPVGPTGRAAYDLSLTFIIFRHGDISGRLFTPPTAAFASNTESPEATSFLYVVDSVD